MPSTTAIISSAVLAGALSYCIWFDQKRRSSPEFRKGLKKRSAQFDKVKQEEANEKRVAIEKLIDQSLEQSKIPEEFSLRQNFFMQEVEAADALLTQGNHLESALAFYRALCAYPNPVELLGVYDKSIKAVEVMEYLRTMIVVRPPPALTAALAGAASNAAAQPDLSVE